MAAPERKTTTATAYRMLLRAIAKSLPRRVRTPMTRLLAGTTPKYRRSELDQVTGPATAVRAPQEAQNRAPTGRSSPQDGQLWAIVDISPRCSRIQRA